jgi:hypothetical protein
MRRRIFPRDGKVWQRGLTMAYREYAAGWELPLRTRIRNEKQDIQFGLAVA